MGEMLRLMWPSHRQKLMSGLWTRLQESFKTDFAFSVSKRNSEKQLQVNAHHLILSIFCPFLKSVQKNAFEFDSQLDIDEVDLKYLLEFIYRGRIDVSVQRLEKLKLAAKHMELLSLVDSIEKYFVSKRRKDSNRSKIVNETFQENFGSKRKMTSGKMTKKESGSFTKIGDDDNQSTTEVTEDEKGRIVKQQPVVVKTRNKTLRAKKKLVLDTKKLFRMRNTSAKLTDADLYDSPHFNPISQTCLLCDKRFKSKQIFRQHVRCHRDPNVMRQCPHCPAKIYSKTNLANHIAWKHQRDLEGNLLEKKFKCDECDFVCVAEFQLKSHKGYKHGEKTQKCDQCSYSCRTNADLMKHKDGVHGVLRPFMCDTCGFCTKTRSGFRLHLTIHQEKIPCDVCGVLYKYRALSRHKRNAHSENKNAFPCHICSYATKCKSYLKVHLTKVHKVSSETSEVPQQSEISVAASSVSVNSDLYFEVNNSLQFDHSSDVYCNL